MNALLLKFQAMWGIKKEFVLKVLFLTLSFFMLTACQAIWRPLKTSVFVSMVGATDVPAAKLLLMLPIIILIVLYSKLVDRYRRHQIFYIFTISHAVVGMILYYFLSHPVYGIANTVQSSSRILGWVFYFFNESFGAFMSAVFWSFANSVNKPNDAKNYYSLFVGGSKIGGILGAGILFLMATAKVSCDAQLIPNFVLAGSFLLLGAALCIYLLMKYVPGYLMHGYEAAYQYEKKKEQEQKSISLWQSIKGGFDGLFIIGKNPYVSGILVTILSYEIIIVIFDYLLLLAASNKYDSAGGLAGFYAFNQFAMHGIGLLIALFGTAPIQRFLGLRLSLFACPLISIIVIGVSMIYPGPVMLSAVVIILRALNYGLNHPTREALFIPTTKAIKFKAKAWTDAFGSRAAKATGSFLNMSVLRGMVSVSASFSMFMTMGWIVIAYFLGKRFNEAVEKNEVIGVENE